MSYTDGLSTVLHPRVYGSWFGCMKPFGRSSMNVICAWEVCTCVRKYHLCLCLCLIFALGPNIQQMDSTWLWIVGKMRLKNRRHTSKSILCFTGLRWSQRWSSNLGNEATEHRGRSWPYRWDNPQKFECNSPADNKCKNDYDVLAIWSCPRWLLVAVVHTKPSSGQWGLWFLFWFCCGLPFASFCSLMLRKLLICSSLLGSLNL